MLTILANLPALRALPYIAMICLVNRDVLLWNSTEVKTCRQRKPGSDVLCVCVCVCVCVCKGSFREIVKRGRKSSLVPTLHTVFTSSRGGGGGNSDKV